MAYGFLDIATTPSVRAVQKAMGCDRFWMDFKGHRESDRFTQNEIDFITARDSMYMASVSETGWPYVQHRGGPPGFIKLVDDRTLAIPDYSGNRQYISAGNLSANPRACLFLMDYKHRARLKMYVHVEIQAIDADPTLTALVQIPDYRARLERLLVLRLQTFDWNCPKYITPRYTELEVAEVVQPILEQLQGLQAENASLRARLGIEPNGQ